MMFLAAMLLVYRYDSLPRRVFVPSTALPMILFGRVPVISHCGVEWRRGGEPVRATMTRPPTARVPEPLGPRAGSVRALFRSAMHLRHRKACSSSHSLPRRRRAAEAMSTLARPPRLAWRHVFFVQYLLTSLRFMQDIPALLLPRAVWRSVSLSRYTTQPSMTVKPSSVAVSILRPAGHTLCDTAWQ